MKPKEYQYLLRSFLWISDHDKVLLLIVQFVDACFHALIEYVDPIFPVTRHRNNRSGYV